MPEGPEIRRAADEVSAALKDRETVEVWFGLDRLKPFEARLTGSKVIAVDTRGKAMLTRFDNGLTIFSHNQLYGRWHSGRASNFPETNRSLRLAIHNLEASALLYSASDIDVLDEIALSAHPFLCKLGPDVLEPSTSIAVILQRMESPRFRARRLGNLLTDQTFLAGLGNYLRCETLFVAGLHPTLRPVDCSEEQKEQLAQAIPRLSRQSYETAGITNDLALAKRLMSRGADFESSRFHLFRRQGKPCYRCGSAIEKISAGGQACYICPGCQIHGR